MGWIESPPYFCTVLENRRDVAEQYTKTPVRSLARHNFVKLTEINSDFVELPNKDTLNEPFNYILDVYVDDYIVLDIPRIQVRLHHVANAIMIGIYDVFHPYKDYKEDAISLNKFLKKEAAWEIIKNVLVFGFFGNQGENIICLTEDFCTDILTKLKNGLGKESIEKGYPL